MPHDLLIDTPTGKRRFGDLQEGDLVFGSNGQSIRIQGVFERGVMPVYRVVFNDGCETLCSGDHLWTVRRFDWSARSRGNTEWETLSTDDLLQRGITRSNGDKIKCRKWAVPTVEPLQYPYRWVPIDPYTMGAWLGDGTRCKASISGNDREVPARIRSAGYTVTERQDPTCLSWRVKMLGPALRQAGVADCGAREKHVPRVYLENVPEVRREVLRGLLDTDGTITKEGTISFSSVSRQLAEDVAWLARSLGGMARFHEYRKSGIVCFVVLLTLPDDRWFYIERKHARVRSISQKRYLWRWIDRIELVGEQPVRCISVDAADGLYVANDAIVTHNTAMSSLAIHWFATTRDGFDWKVVSTASAWRQLTKYLWPEIHKWANRLRWDRIGRMPYTSRELMTLALKLRTGSAFAVASSNHEYIEGAHADYLMYIFDEAKAIPDTTFDAAEGAFSGAGDDTAVEAYALAISTPGEPLGRFYDLHQGKPEYKDWYARWVKVEEAIKAKRISRNWMEARKLQWGEDSLIFKNRVLGEFGTSETDGTIPWAWVSAAQERYPPDMEAIPIPF